MLSRQAERWPLFIAATVAVSLSSLFIGRLVGVARRLTAGLLLVGLIAWGLWLAWSVKWLCDDAYISFTYARRFVEGHGFVLNPGERVEGYTNFLWVFFLGLFGKLGADIPLVALFGNLAFFISLIIAAEAIASGTSTRGFLGAVPLAAGVTALGRPFYTFATSGLETVVGVALAAWAVFCWQRQRAVWAGVLFALSAMTRPDFLLLAGGAWAVTLVESRLGAETWRRTITRLLALAVPTLTVFTAFWVWRWNYYADFFPNTFYAKSGSGAYWSQGTIYALHAVLSSGVAWIVLPLLGALVWHRRDASRRPLMLYAVIIAATHGLYVARVGGDFMEFRFLLPELFFAVVAWDVAIRDGLQSWEEHWKRLAWVPVVALSWAVLVLNAKPIGFTEKRWFLAAEETFYELNPQFPWEPKSDLRTLGLDLKKTLVDTGLNSRMALGCIGMVAYYSGLPLMDTYGLADAIVAHKPVAARGRPGHERHADVEDMLLEEVVFSDGLPWPGREDDTRVQIGPRFFWLVRHEPRLEAHARKVGWSYPNIDANIERALLLSSREQIVAARDFYARFLGATPGREDRLKRFDDLLSGAALADIDATRLDAERFGIVLRQSESLGLSALHAALEPRIEFRANFEAPEEGDGQKWTSTGTLPNQSPVTGYQGKRLFNSYQSGDASVGSVTIELPSGPGKVLSLLVGGGNNCRETYVALRVNNTELARWCGRRDEQLRQAIFPLDSESPAQLQLVDQSTGGWGHLLVDDVLVFSK